MSGENTDPRIEPGIGRRLERARNSRGLSLWEVEQEIRIRSRYLHDLERENFDVLPAVYVLGSLKTYADFLGLDGTALSRQLKASLVEPDVPEQLASLGGAPDGDDEYEAAPVPAVGFDQLFLGMGVILVSILAVMTIVAAVAQGDESPISQINQPSTPEAPSEIALAGNVREEDGADEVGNGSPANDETREDQPKDEAPKGDEDGDEGEDADQKEDADSSRSASLFGDPEFVPVSPSSSPTPDASASASPAPASPAPASLAPASPAPTTAEPDDARASSAPEATVPSTPSASTAPGASAGESQRPPGDAPGAASPAPGPSGGASLRAEGGGEGAPTGGSNSDPMSTEAGRVADEALERVGIIR